jgi:dTDP-D-glucose 4,6-dehydratase
MRIFVTGGAGFIGSALVRHLIENTDHEVLNFDKLTYAGTLSTVERVAESNRYRFVQGDICDAKAVKAAITEFKPEIVTHLAAESHVDRSIDGPGAFVQTNVVGTFTMLSEARAYGPVLTTRRRRRSASITSRPTRSMVRSAISGCSPKRRRTIRARLTRHRRRALTISLAPGAIHSGCRC